MKSLIQLVRSAEFTLNFEPEYDEHVDRSWENWFERTCRRYRSAIGNLIMEGGGSYQGGVGDHSLDLGGVFVISEDGYRGLLSQWAAAARMQLEPQAVPA